MGRAHSPRTLIDETVDNPSVDGAELAVPPRVAPSVQILLGLGGLPAPVGGYVLPRTAELPLQDDGIAVLVSFHYLN